MLIKDKTFCTDRRILLVSRAKRANRGTYFKKAWYFESDKRLFTLPKSIVCFILKMIERINEFICRRQFIHCLLLFTIEAGDLIDSVKSNINNAKKWEKEGENPWDFIWTVQHRVHYTGYFRWSDPFGTMIILIRDSFCAKKSWALWVLLILSQ